MDGETLVSSGQIFELGLFSPGDSDTRCLGIWYKKFPNTVVWVANRGKRVAGRNGIYMLVMMEILFSSTKQRGLSGHPILLD